MIMTSLVPIQQQIKKKKQIDVINSTPCHSRQSYYTQSILSLAWKATNMYIQREQLRSHTLRYNGTRRRHDQHCPWINTSHIQK